MKAKKDTRERKIEEEATGSWAPGELADRHTSQIISKRWWPAGRITRTQRVSTNHREVGEDHLALPVFLWSRESIQAFC